MHDLDQDLTLQELYYRPEDYYQTAKKIQDACKDTGHEFTLIEIKNWLNRQALHKIHKLWPKFISQVSFNNITILIKVIQADLCYIHYDQIGNKT